MRSRPNGGDSRIKRTRELVPGGGDGPIRYADHRFSLQLRTVRLAARLTSTSATQDQWNAERTSFDLSGSFKLTRTYDLTLSGRNISNRPTRGYTNQPGYLRTMDYLGAVWTVGARGRF